MIAGYRVERLLGSGGMGAVFLARHPELPPRYDALKVLKGSAGLTDNNFRRRFLREAEVAATLDHPPTSSPSSTVAGRPSPHRVEVRRVGSAVDRDAVRAGHRLARELGDIGRFTLPRVAHIVSQVARGIDHANRRGLTHRDVKPGTSSSPRSTRTRPSTSSACC